MASSTEARRSGAICVVTPTSRAITSGAAHHVDFEDFYAASHQALTIQLFAYLGDLQEAQDVVQEAFCRALTRWRKISTYDDPVAWVRRVAWNLSTSRWRRLRVAQAFLARQREDVIDGPNPDHVELVRALAKVADGPRRIFVMFHIADMPIAEIATQLGLAEGTVKSTLHRTRIVLAKALAEQDKGESHD